MTKINVENFSIKFDWRGAESYIRDTAQYIKLKTNINKCGLFKIFCVALK